MNGDKMSFKDDEAYFLWLCGLVEMDDPERGYLGALRQMYDDEFSESTAVLVGNDINRIGDGLALRDAYEGRAPSGPCSTLEMLIALADRMSLDLGYMSKDDWFWCMIHNLRLDHHRWDYKDVACILRNLRKRKYAKDGLGGLFPLYSPTCDQREVEIWYQMQAYVVENFS